MLTDKQLDVLRAGLKRGYLEKSHGLVRPRLATARSVYDEVRHRDLASGDFRLTGWGRLVAANYKRSVECLPVGTVINHRIHAYKRGSVVLADDSMSMCTVDTRRPLKVSPNYRHGEWLIPRKGGGFTFGTADESWYLRNLLGMAIELDIRDGDSVDDFDRD